MKRPYWDSVNLAHNAPWNHDSNHFKTPAQFKYDDITASVKTLTNVRDTMAVIVKLILTAPQFAMSSILVFVHVSVIWYYVSLGVDLPTVFITIAVSRCLDALVDPLIAHTIRFKSSGECSDDQDEASSEHMNKVRMYMWMLGLLAFFIIFVMLLSPGSDMASGALSAHFSALYLLFVLSYSCIALPYGTVLSETGRGRAKGEMLQVYFMSSLWENAGLFLLFLVCTFVPFQTDSASAMAAVSSAGSQSCFDHNGTTHSCSGLPGRGGAVNVFQIFDPVLWSIPFNVTATNSTSSSDGFTNSTTIGGVNGTIPGSVALNATCRWFQESVLESPLDLYTPANCRYHTINGCLSEYCRCLSECAALGEVAASTDSAVAIAVVMGLALLFSSSWLIPRVYGSKTLDDAFDLLIGPPPPQQQHQQSGEGDNVPEQIHQPHAALAETALPSRRPFIPSLLGVLNNPLFRSVAVPWGLDTLAYMMVLCTMWFFVAAAIEPENAAPDADGGGRDCNYGVPVPGTDSDSWQCRSTAVTGVILTVIVLAAGLSNPAWYYLAKTFGRTRIWQLGSLVSFLCTLVFVFTSGRSVDTAVGLSIFLGIGFGPRFLADVVMSDVTDHDEFVSGQRNDSLVAALKPLSVKLSAFLSTLLPLAVLMALGWNDSYYSASQSYVYEPQNRRVHDASIAFTVAVPAVLSLVSYTLKLRQRLRVDAQSAVTAFGARMHRLRKSSMEPLSGVQYPAVHYALADVEVVHLVDYFPTLDAAVDFRACVLAGAPHIAVRLMVRRMRDRLGAAFIFFVGCLVGAILTGGYFGRDTGLFIVPAMFIVLLGYSLTVGAVYSGRLLAALALKSDAAQPSAALLDKMVKNRAALRDMGTGGRRIRDIVRDFRTKKRSVLQRLLAKQREAKAVADAEAALLAAAEAEAETQTVLEWEGRRHVDGGEGAEELRALDREDRLLELNLARLRENARKQEAELAKSRAEAAALKARPPLTVWDVEMFSFVLEQQRDNHERRAAGGGGLEEEGGEGTSTDTSSSDSGGDRDDDDDDDGHGSGGEEEKKEEEKEGDCFGEKDEAEGKDEEEEVISGGDEEVKVVDVEENEEEEAGSADPLSDRVEIALQKPHSARTTHTGRQGLSVPSSAASSRKSEQIHHQLKQQGQQAPQRHRGSTPLDKNHGHNSGDDNSDDSDSDDGDGDAVRINFHRLAMDKNIASVLQMTQTAAPVRRANATMYQSRKPTVIAPAVTVSSTLLGTGGAASGSASHATRAISSSNSSGSSSGRSPAVVSGKPKRRNVPSAQSVPAAAAAAAAMTTIPRSAASSRAVSDRGSSDGSDD